MTSTSSSSWSAAPRSAHPAWTTIRTPACRRASATTAVSRAASAGFRLPKPTNTVRGRRPAGGMLRPPVAGHLDALAPVRGPRDHERAVPVDERPPGRLLLAVQLSDAEAGHALL